MVNPDRSKAGRHVLRNVSVRLAMSHHTIPSNVTLSMSVCSRSRNPLHQMGVAETHLSVHCLSDLISHFTPSQNDETKVDCLMVLRFWFIIEVKHRLETQPEILNAEHESPTSTTTTTILLVVNFWAKVAPRIAELRLLASFMKNKI